MEKSPPDEVKIDVLDSTATKFINYYTKRLIEAHDFDIKIDEDKTRYSSWLSAAATGFIGLSFSSLSKQPEIEKIALGIIFLLSSIIIGALVLMAFNESAKFNRLIKTGLLKQELEFLSSSDASTNFKFSPLGMQFNEILKKIEADPISQLMKKISKLTFLREKDREEFNKYYKRNSFFSTAIEWLLLAQIIFVFGGILLIFIRLLQIA